MLINEYMKDLSPERKQIAKILNRHLNAAIAELGHSYDVDVSGDFFYKTVKMKIEVMGCNGKEIP